MRIGMRTGVRRVQPTIRGIVGPEGRRSATCCRSPHPPITIIWRNGPIRPAVGSCVSGQDVTARDPTRLRGELERLRRPQGLAAIATEGFDVARCTVSRLMRVMGIQGVIRGKPHRTTIPDKKLPSPLDRVNRQFRVPAPNMLWVSDFTYVATWKGFVYVAFVIDAYARRIVGWRVSTSPHAGFVLDALEQAVHERRPVKGMGLVHHSDRGSQYLSIKYTERLAETGIEPSVGSVGDSYDNALAETINGLFKAEVIHRRGPWRSFEAVEYATLEWVDWFNNRRLLEPVGNIPPAEAEANYYAARLCCTNQLLAGLPLSPDGLIPRLL